MPNELSIKYNKKIIDGVCPSIIFNIREYRRN